MFKIKKIQNLLSFFFPPTCVCCERFIPTDHYVCEDCEKGIIAVETPKCPRCSVPRIVKSGVDALCFRCIQEKRYFDHVTSAFEYSINTKKILSRTKYGSRPDTIKALTRLALSRGLLQIPDIENALWTSVPMHSKDLCARGFNTSRLILNTLREVGIAEKDSNLFRKVRRRKRGNNKEERQQFAQSAYQLKTEVKVPVIIVDDVMSSGATLSALSRLLKKSGAPKVQAIVLARNL